MARRREKKKSLFSKQNVVGLLIVIIMVTSGLAMWGGGESTTFKYKDYKFKQYYNYLTTKINNKEARFYHTPDSLENTTLDSAIVDKLKNSKMWYILFDPQDKNIQTIELTRIELSETDLPKHFNIYVAPAITDLNPLYPDFPILSCENATADIPVLYLKTDNETQITMEENCITMQGPYGYEIQAMKDRLLYGMFGIIQ